MSRILVIDDEPGALDYVRRVLEPSHEIVTCPGGTEGIARLRGEPFDLIVTDLGMPAPDGFDVLHAVAELTAAPPVIVLTATDRAGATLSALRLGALDYVLKPASADDLRAAIGGALAGREGSGPVETFGLIGESRAMRELRRILPLFARVDESVLLIGETGVGKELVARALHLHGPHAGGPFVAHNMAATPTELGESLFFGHARGAFSGAHADHAGLFEQADGGTLFLDELDSFPLAMQAKLLRVIETHRVQRVGASGERAVDVRIVAASAVDPADLVKRGAFRADLLFRLRQLEIHLPPLRDRREDVPDLLRHRITEVSRQLGREIHLSIPALQRLLAHDWPGNVRELRQVIRTAALMAESGTILPRHLPPTLQRPVATPSLEGSRLDAVEEEHIMRTLRLTEGNQKRAAELLGIDRGTLARRLRRFGA